MGILSLPLRPHAPVALLLATLAAATPAASLWQTGEWALTDVEGRRLGAEELEGRVVLLDFWATWCAPCLAELPNLRRLHERHADADLVIVGIALDSIERRSLRSFLLRHDVEWPQVHEREGTRSPIARRLDVEAVPVTILVDRRGRIVARDLRGEALVAVIETLLAMPDEHR